MPPLALWPLGPGGAEGAVRAEGEKEIDALARERRRDGVRMLDHRSLRRRARSSTRLLARGRKQEPKKRATASLARGSRRRLRRRVRRPLVNVAAVGRSLYEEPRQCAHKRPDERAVRRGDGQ